MDVKLQEMPPTAQNETGEASELSDENRDWLKLAQKSFRSALSYVDNNYRKSWDDSIRAFNNQHASDSKYLQPSYDKRSRLFRPKVRSIIRKNEAAGAAAFFSSMDVVSVTGADPNNPRQQASAEVNKALMQYRLAKSIPWYQVLLGGLQDAQSTGVAVAHVYWDYADKKTPKKPSKTSESAVSGNSEYPQQAQVPKNAYAANEDGTEQSALAGLALEEQEAEDVTVLTDKPCIDLIPLENLLVDPAANWTDPINSSPYVIHMIPMYFQDVWAKMTSGQWKTQGKSVIAASMETKYDSTRSARLQAREDPYNPNDKSFTGYEICWVHRHIHRRDGEDWEFYMLSDLALLTEPRPLKETVFHGLRPYVMGVCMLEAHKLFPSSLPQLGRGLQDEANEVVNQRIDNVKFVLNKKWFVKRGKEADIGGLVRNVPGGVVMLDDPEGDVKEVSWPDVTASAYEEQSRIDNDMNDLLGNFSPGQVMADKSINGPARNMEILTQSSGTLVEYLLRTFVETFIQPVLRQLVLLEQKYETDEKVLALASSPLKLAERYGVDEITDDIIEQELNLNVNVGMGATDPQLKLMKFMTACGQYVQMFSQAGASGLNMPEVGKEIFSYMGYQDGSRFLSANDPQKQMLSQQVQEMSGIIQTLEAKLKNKQTDQMLKLKLNEDNNQLSWAKSVMHEDNENMRNATTHLRAIREAERDRDQEWRLRQTERAVSRINHVKISEAMKGERQ